MKHLARAAVAGALLLGLGACAGGAGYYSYNYRYSDEGYWRDYDSRYYGYRSYRDRDGDGVPNRYDDYPRNPRYD